MFSGASVPYRKLCEFTHEQNTDNHILAQNICSNNRSDLLGIPHDLPHQEKSASSLLDRLHQ